MIEFESLEIEGFSSVIKRTKYQLNLPGVNIIRGKNGSGKTTILNALAWVLFGKTIKKKSTINPWPALVTKEYKGTIGIITYNKDGIPRKITHCNGYKGKVNGNVGKDKLIFEIDGVPQDKLRDKNDVKKAIIEDLGFTFELFKSTVLFGQKVERIIDADGPERNSVLEQAFEASFISVARKKLEEKLRDSKPVLYKQEMVVNGLGNSLSELKQKQEEYKGTLHDFKVQKNEKIKKYQSIISDLKEQNLKLQNILLEAGDIKKEIGGLNKKLKSLVLGNYNDLTDREFKLNLNTNTLKGRLEELQQKLKTLVKELWNLPITCNACGAELDKKGIEKQKKRLKEQVLGYKRDIKYLKSDIEEKDQEYQGVIQQIDSFNKKKKKIDNLKEKIKLLEASEKSIRDYKYRIKANKESITTYRDLIEETKTQTLNIDFKSLEIKIKSIQNHYDKENLNLGEMWEIYRIDEWLLKDPLSNTGLKTFIFDAMLRQTNRELMKYEDVMGLKIKLGINDNKRRDFLIRVFRYNEEIPHTDLSGGEKQLGDLAITLAISDSIRENKAVNCLFLDEVFESLDDENVEKVTEMLRIKAKDRNIHIITHLSTFAPVGANYTYVTKNSKGYTNVKQAVAQV